MWSRGIRLVLTLVITFSLTACDEGAMLVLNVIGDRPDFYLHVEQDGPLIRLDAHEGKEFVTYDDNGLPEFRVELYELYGGPGSVPYGTFTLINTGHLEQQKFYWDLQLPKAGTYHYRVGILDTSDTFPEPRINVRSTPVTVTWP